ncbi:MAG: hypothetical protein Q7R73_01495 [bacterium]|nr:hypothetical protein [bacterium]
MAEKRDELLERLRREINAMPHDNVSTPEGFSKFCDRVTSQTRPIFEKFEHLQAEAKSVGMWRIIR